MNLIDHPKNYKDGTRVLMLSGRHKDGISDQRKVLRVSHSPGEFDMWLSELVGMARESERVYACAGARDLEKSIRVFKERQLANDYDSDPSKFYRKLNTRWCSCLMQPTCQKEKTWLFDCDGADDFEIVQSELCEHYTNSRSTYDYQTKSGKHVVVGPFNKSKLSDHARSLLNENALLLWGY